jgi:hypothetical protein
MPDAPRINIPPHTMFRLSPGALEAISGYHSAVFEGNPDPLVPEATHTIYVRCKSRPCVFSEDKKTLKVAFWKWRLGRSLNAWGSGPPNEVEWFVKWGNWPIDYLGSVPASAPPPEKEGTQDAL